MKKQLPAAARIPLKIAGVGLGFFAVTFTVYMLNLDMKLTHAIEPFFLKHYDNMERNQRV